MKMQYRTLLLHYIKESSIFNIISGLMDVVPILTSVIFTGFYGWTLLHVSAINMPLYGSSEPYLDFDAVLLCH